MPRHPMTWENLDWAALDRLRVLDSEILEAYARWSELDART